MEQFGPNWTPLEYSAGVTADSAPTEAEAVRRGCDRVAVSSFTFQAPGFYQRHGYVETGRMLGIPDGHEDVHMFKRLTALPA